MDKVGVMARQKANLRQASGSMDLQLGSGETLTNVTEDDIRQRLVSEEFAILYAGEGTYMQCAEQADPPVEYLLEYQEGSLDAHYEAVDHPITLARAVDALCKYLRGDDRWRTDFTWRKMDLHDEVG